MVTIEEITELCDTLNEVIAMSLCAEAAAEDEVQTVLGIMTGNMLAMKMDLEGMRNRMRGYEQTA